MAVADEILEFVYEWNRPQSIFMRATERYVDLEGAVRSGKTTALVRKVVDYCTDYPGIHCLLARWTDDSLKAQLKPRFYELCQRELLGPGPKAMPGTNESGWHAEEQYQEFRNGSRVYLRALKSSDEATRLGKFAGLTLGVIGVDQPEELPKDIHEALKARLSQPGFPQQLLYTPNPPGHDHWLSEEFPETNARPDYLYLTTEVYDNEKWLGKKYIEALEETYPPGHVLHRRFILGKRGLSTQGEPVYGKVFKRRIHVAEVAAIPTAPLMESWDFGHKHPAVLWSQLGPDGSWHILGELMGDESYIEDFAPQVIAVRKQLFPEVGEVWSCCDPAGADHNSHGLRFSAIDVLRDFGIYPRFIKGSNSLSQRDWAIQQTARYMLRLTKRGPALVVHPRCVITIDGFEAGYVYDDRHVALQTTPNIRRPKKDGYYDHLQNNVEYTMLNFISGLPVAIGTSSDARRTLRAMQRDNDPYERDERARRRAPAGRAGY